MKKLNLRINYPQNYIIKKPLLGAFILFVFSLGFTILYHPLDTQKSFYYNFELTMVLYAFVASFFAWLAILLLKKIPSLSNIEDWSLLNEIVSAYLVLQVMGVAIFMFAFIIESPTEATRWNINIFLDSCKYSFLIGIFPFAFFTLINYKFIELNFVATVNEFQDENKQALVVNINSTLKRESLSFYASELLFVNSDGNYVFFYLFRDNKIKKVPIRNSISNIENQLKQIPYYFRCHRAFIVNLNMVQSKKGNALGYHLRMVNCEDKIPVSRKYVKVFDSIFTKPFI